MNFVLKDRGPDAGYFIVSVVRDEDQFLVRSKRIDCHGNILVWNDVNADGTFSKARFDTVQEAKMRAKALVASKRKRQNMIDVDEKDVPNFTKKQMVAPLSAQVKTVELLEAIARARRERYVVFKDVSGLEGLFDVGVQYVGYITEDSNMMDVYDKFGECRGILDSRLKSCEKTEQCLEAQG